MSVQDLYKRYKAGKISKYNFIEEVKKNQSLPWITNLNSINEIVSILKSKNIIWEDKVDEILGTGETVTEDQGADIRKWNDAHMEGGPLEEEDDFSDFSDDFPMSMEYDDDPMDTQMIGSPEFNDMEFDDNGEFDDEGNELPGEIYGDEPDDTGMYDENTGVAPGMDGESEFDVPFQAMGEDEKPRFSAQLKPEPDVKRPDKIKRPVTTSVWSGPTEHNSVWDIVDYLKKNPGKSEKDIVQDVFGEPRGKKHAELLKRALQKGIIQRAKKITGDGRTKYFYFLPGAKQEQPVKETQPLNEAKTVALTIDTVNPYEFKRGMNWESGLTYSSVPDWGFKFLDQEKYKSTVEKVLGNLTKDPTYYSKKLAGEKTTGKPDLSSKAEFGAKSKRHDVSTPFKVGKKNIDKREGNAMKTVGKLEKTNTKDTQGKKEVGAGNPVKIKTFKDPGTGKMKKFKALKESLLEHFKKKVTEGQLSLALKDKPMPVDQAYQTALKLANIAPNTPIIKKKDENEIAFGMPGGKYIDSDKFDAMFTFLNEKGYTIEEADYSDDDRRDYVYYIFKKDVAEAFAQKSPEGETLDITRDPGGADSQITTKAKKLGVQVKSTKL